MDPLRSSWSRSWQAIGGPVDEPLFERLIAARQAALEANAPADFAGRLHDLVLDGSVAELER